MEQNKNHILQLLRFLFVLIIVTYNFPIDSILYKNLIIKNINLFITFFFVLSSYIFFFKFSQQRINLTFVKNYLKKRFLRFYPIHFILLIFFVAIEIVKNLYIKEYNYIPLYKGYDLNDLITNFLFLNGFELSPHSFNQPSWAISLLIWTILFYAFINLWSRKFSFFLSIFISIFLFLIIFTNYNYDFMYKYRNLLLLLSFSVTQVLCYTIFEKNILQNKKIFFVLLTLIIVFLFYFFKDLSTIFFYFIVIFYFFKINMRLESSKLKKIFIYLGNVSFIWFMSHYLFTFLTRQILKILYEFKINLDDNTIIFGNGSDLMIICVILGSLVFSILLYEINEKILNIGILKF